MVDISKALQNHEDLPDDDQALSAPLAQEVDDAEEIDDADLIAASDLELAKEAAARRAQEAGLITQAATPISPPLRAPRKKKVRPDMPEMDLVAPRSLPASEDIRSVPEAATTRLAAEAPANKPPETSTHTAPVAPIPPSETITVKGDVMTEKKTDFVPIKAVDGVRLDQPQGVVTVTPANAQLANILAGTAPDPKTTVQIMTDAATMNPFRVQGMITRGDVPLSVTPAPEKAETLEEKLTRLGFPPRPAKWPAFIDWPPREVAEKFTDPAVNDEQRQKMIRLMLSLEEAAIRRARQVNEWLNETNPLIAPGFANRTPEARTMRRNMRLVKATQDDPHHSIRWATLINPMSQNQALLNSVVTWGQGSASTLDGGQVLVDKDSICFAGGSRAALPYSPQAIALGIQEAKNRGWKTLNMSGSFEFGQLAIKAAREAGIEAEITFYGKGLQSFRKFTVKVSPNVPFVDKDITEMMTAAMGDPVAAGVASDGPARTVPNLDQSPFASQRSREDAPLPSGDSPPYEGPDFYRDHSPS